jgi:hypothetical protein
VPIFISSGSLAKTSSGRSVAASASAASKILFRAQSTDDEASVDETDETPAPRRSCAWRAATLLPRGRAMPPPPLFRSKKSPRSRRGSSVDEVSYGYSNEFFRLWLDERMNYTSAALTPDQSLEAAQLNKPDPCFCWAVMPEKR